MLTALALSLGLDQRPWRARRGGSARLGKIAVRQRLLKASARPGGSRVSAITIVGDALCAGLRSLQTVRPIVRHHHERLDGTGYPDGLRNADVPLLAQIVGIVDVFDALTMERPYRAALSRDVAFEVLADEAAKGWRDRVLSTPSSTRS